MSIKKTYIPAKPRSSKLVGTSTGGIMTGGISSSTGSTDPNSHTHPNKRILDQLTQADINVLEKLSLVDGNLRIDANAYSTGELSAFGFEEEEGGGVIINVIDSLTSTSTTDALSANQGRYLKTLIDNIEVGEGGQVLLDWEAITGKPDTFAPSAHTHIIGDVTGLQSALDGKASLSQLDDKEDKFTKNSAFNKNFGTGLNDVARGNHTHEFASLTSIPTTLAGYGITDAYTKTNVDALLSGKENAFTKNSAFNKNFGTTVGTVAQGNHTHVSLDTVDNRNIHQKPNEYSKGFYTEFKTSYAGLSGFSGVITYRKYGSLDDFSGGDSLQLITTTDNKLLKRFGEKETWGELAEIWDSGNHRSNTENDTRYKAPFDAFKTNFDTMFRKTPTNEIEAKLSLYTLGGLSAYGFSDEGSSGGGGGIVNILSDWAIYDASKSGWALGAGLGKGLYDNKADKTDQRFTDARTPLAHTHVISDITGLQTALNAKTNQTFSDGLNTRLTNVESGSATTINVSGTGDLLASVSKVDNNINFIKGNQSWGNLSGKPSTFAPSAHSHPISDITNLQTTLADKLETSIFNTHNNDNVRHITGAERTKWNGVVTDFGNLEIGGRNLFPMTKLRAITFSNGSVQIGTGTDAIFSAKGTGWTIYPIGLTTPIIPPNTDFIVSFEVRNTQAGFGFEIIGASSNTTVIARRVFENPTDEWVRMSSKYNSGSSAIIGGISLYNQGDIRRIKFEKGNKATDWQPAPEDQVSDWNTTDVDSFSFIKNKPTLLSQFTDNIGVATHIANKANPHDVTKAQVGLSNVDNIQQATKVEFMTQKALFDSMFRKVGTNIEAKLPFYSLGGLSAYGFSDEGTSSGSGIVNILDDWTNYDASKSGWALSAGLGENLRTRVVALENAKIDLSGYATLNYVNDKVKTDVPLNAKFTDTIVDISGKVDKVTGKGLSTNDFTTVEKNKLAILENQTRESLGVENVTNESKATMFTNPTFTGTTKVDLFEANSFDIQGTGTFYDLVTMVDGLRVFGTTETTNLEVGTNWKVLKTGNELEFRYNNVKKATLTPNGDLIVTGGMIAYQ